MDVAGEADGELAAVSLGLLRRDDLQGAGRQARRELIEQCSQVACESQAALAQHRHADVVEDLQ